MQNTVRRQLGKHKRRPIVYNMSGIGSWITNVIRSVEVVLKIPDNLLGLDPYRTVKHLSLHLIRADSLPDYLNIGIMM